MQSVQLNMVSVLVEAKQGTVVLAVKVFDASHIAAGKSFSDEPKHCLGCKVTQFWCCIPFDGCSHWSPAILMIWAGHNMHNI